MTISTYRLLRSFFLTVGFCLVLTGAGNVQAVAGGDDFVPDLTSDSTVSEAGAADSANVDSQGSAGYGDFTRYRSTAPAWSVTADALFLHRSGAQSDGIIYDQNSGDELLNASDLGLGTQTGPRLILLRSLGAGWLLDLEYFGMDGWSATDDFGPGEFRVLGDQSQSGPDVSSASILYASRFRTAEINLRAPGTSWLQPLAGFRWIGLNETYQVSGGFESNPDPIPYILRYGTRNNLYGGQVGANAILWDRGGSLTITSLSKAGLYLGDSINSGSFNAEFGPNSLNFNGNGHRQRASFFGEVGVVANWQINEHLALRGGYQLYWLSGVALAPNQPPSTDLVNQTGGINNSGHTFMHGPSAGFQVSW